MITVNYLKEKIERKIPGTTAEVIAVKNDGMHFKAIVKSKKFEGKSRVEQHRMIYDALEDDFKKGLHSLSIEVID